jgi:hypothetical protein
MSAVDNYGNELTVVLEAAAYNSQNNILTWGKLTKTCDRLLLSAAVVRSR